MLPTIYWSTATWMTSQEIVFFVFFFNMMSVRLFRILYNDVAHDLLEYSYMDDVTGNLFSLFFST